MAAGSFREVCTLSNADIASVMEKLERWLEQQKVEKQNLLQLSLSLEEILLRWQDHFGPEQAVTVVLSRRLRISPLKLLRKMLPALTVALGTSSSAAAYSTHVKCCEKDLCISPKITGFGIPLGTVAYIPLVSIYFLLCVFCGAEQYGTACSAVWLVVACLSASLLAFATPPVPGGAVACYAVLFAQMGIPAEALALALAMDAVIDRFNTTANLAMQQLELLDHDRLHADL